MIARYAIFKLALTAVGAALFVAVSGWMLGSPDFGDIIKFIAVIAILVFGGAGLYALVAIFDRRPVLTIDDTGVFDRRSMDRKVPWSEVHGISAITVRGKPFYYLDVGEPLNRFTDNGLKRWFLGLNQGFSKGITVSPHSLDVAPGAIREALEAHSPEHAG